MTTDAIPNNCKECPNARENAYTKAWYCTISGAPLGSKRALDFCTCTKKPSGGAPSASNAGSSPAGQPVGPTPEASQGAAGASSASQQQSAADGYEAQQQAEANSQLDEDLMYGYPFDFM